MFAGVCDTISVQRVEHKFVAITENINISDFVFGSQGNFSRQIYRIIAQLFNYALKRNIVVRYRILVFAVVGDAIFVQCVEQRCVAMTGNINIGTVNYFKKRGDGVV